MREFNIEDIADFGNKIDQMNVLNGGYLTWSELLEALFQYKQERRK